MVPSAALILSFATGCTITFLVLAILRRAPDEYFFKNLRIEREFWVESRGFILKEQCVVIKERLLYKQFPLTGWAQTERCTEQALDTKAIESLVHSATNLIASAQTPFPLKTMLRQLPNGGR